MSNCVGWSGTTAQHIDGGAEADGGRGIRTAERVFEGVERLDVEVAKAIAGGGREDGAETAVLGPEGRILFLEPEIDGGAVNRSFARCASDGGSSEEMVQDLEL